MMLGAGTYNRRFNWQKHTAGGIDSHGQRQESYPSQGYLWGALDAPGGGPVQELQRDRDQLTAVIRLRNYPAVVPLDRLHDQQDGVVWKVVSVRRGPNELVCEVET